MSNIINIHSAKTHLSRLVEKAAAGEEIIIAKAGKPMARLVPLGAGPQPKKLGQLRDKLKVPDDFNAPLSPQLMGLFEGR